MKLGQMLIALPSCVRYAEECEWTCVIRVRNLGRYSEILYIGYVMHTEWLKIFGIPFRVDFKYADSRGDSFSSFPEKD